MSIETLLTLVVAAGIMVGAAILRALVVVGIKLFVIVREWVTPAPARHRVRTQRAVPLAVPLAAPVSRFSSRH